MLLFKYLLAYFTGICSPDIRNVSALEVLRNRALQIDIYLLTYIIGLAAWLQPSSLSFCIAHS